MTGQYVYTVNVKLHFSDLKYITKELVIRFHVWYTLP